MTERKPPSRLKVLSLNVNNSREGVMAPLLRDPNALRFDIIAIQEPWRLHKDYGGGTHNPAKDLFTAIVPPEEDEDTYARTCIFVNKRIAHRNITTYANNPHICTIKIIAAQDDGEDTPVYIHSVYNPPRDDVGLRALETALKRADEEPRAEGTRQPEHVIVGDFNVHHAMWGGRGTTSSSYADHLLGIIDSHDLTFSSPRGKGTRNILQQGTQTNNTLDLVLLSRGLVDQLERCILRPSLCHDSDHLPTETVLRLAPPLEAVKEHKQWERVDPDRFRDMLDMSLPDPPDQPLDTEEEVDGFAERITEAIGEAIRVAVPVAISSQKYERPGFTPECKAAVEAAKAARVRVRRRPGDEELQEEYRQARQKKKRMVKRSLTKAHRERVTAANGDIGQVWKLAKWARDRTPRQAFTPTLRAGDVTADTAAAKVKLLGESFFPKPPLHSWTTSGTRSIQSH